MVEPRELIERMRAERKGESYYAFEDYIVPPLWRRILTVIAHAFRR